MRPTSIRLLRGFTPIELVIVVACSLIIAALVLPHYLRRRATYCGMNCVNNLKQTGLAFRTFALDNHDLYPMQFEAARGGTLDYIGQGKTWMHLSVMSNEIGTPRILVCPQDTERVSATTFATSFPTPSPYVPFCSNSNLSYFVAVDADENFPNRLLAGDRWLGNSGMQFRPGFHLLPSNNAVQWVNSPHHNKGNVALADGSVEELNSRGVQAILLTNGLATNRIEIP